MRILDNTGLVQAPIRLGVVILENQLAEIKKKIEDLKVRLPFLSKLGKSRKKKDDDDEEEEDEEATDKSDATQDTDVEEIEADDGGTKTKSLLMKLKARLSSKKEEVADDDSDDDDDEEKTQVKKTTAQAPNKRTKIIRLIIVGAVVVLIAQEFIPSEEEVPADAQIKLKPRPRPKKKDTAETPSPDPSATPETVPSTPTTVDTGDLLPGEKPATMETPGPSETPTVSETPSPEPTPSPVTTETIEPTPSPTPSETPSTETGSKDTVDDTGAPTDDSSMTDKILKDLEDQAKKDQKPKQITEYVSPPDYEYTGRGLVYNCTGKHWACVDGASYKMCEDNISGNKFLKKKIECYPFNVYESQQGCAAMQNRMVSSGAKTEFCNGD